MEKNPTISDVAKKSGVSKTTVSRYINGKYENISVKTRERIKNVMNELSYIPNKSAQRLKSNRSMLIGCVLGDLCSPFAPLLLKGITNICDEVGYQVLFADTNDDLNKEKKAIESLVANRVDGLVINTAGGNEELLCQLKNQGIPIVLADRGISKDGVIDTVEVANENITYECMRYLSKLGYQKVAFFTEGNKKVMPRIKRYLGYLRGIKDFFIEQKEPECYIFEKNNDISTEKYISMFKNAHIGEKIAILAVNGVAARSIIFAMNNMGIKLGKDFGICGFDNWDWFKLTPSGVVLVDMPTIKIGEEAMKLLLDRILYGLKEQAKLLTLEAEIIVKCDEI